MYGYGLDGQSRITVDLHQMDTAQAKKWLAAKVSAAPKEVKEMEVIHGYRSGTALLNMVRKSFTHPRVARKILGLNPGSTVLILK